MSGGELEQGQNVLRRGNSMSQKLGSIKWFGLSLRYSYWWFCIIDAYSKGTEGQEIPIWLQKFREF